MDPYVTGRAGAGGDVVLRPRRDEPFQAVVADLLKQLQDIAAEKPDAAMVADLFGVVKKFS
jgi:hypothetical protein